MDLFDLFAKITLDTGEYEEKLGEAGEKANSFGDKLKSGLASAAKAGAAALTAASTAVVALTKSSIDNYGEYEQLVGGVETLFKSSSDTVMGYAENAYKTAGLSANQYMDTVTSFSASLLQSLDNDTAAAAEKANLAITDMADNANKMGTSMESIQNAYQGFAKQNFTMLDNLKLGYGGTKEEMQRLLDDAEKLSGIEYDISSYADIVDAIHVVQTEMGITGTTAQEASTTIQGSVASMKSAWQNLVTGIADENADLDTLIGNFVDSVATAGENIIPRVEQILLGVGTLVSKLAPIIAEDIPKIVIEVLPSLLEAGISMLEGIAAGIIDALPALLETAIEIVLTLADGIAQNLPELIPTLVDVVTQITETLIDNVDMLVDAAIAIILALAEGITNAVPRLIEKAPEIVIKLVQAIIRNAPKLIEGADALIKQLVYGIAMRIEAVVNIGKDMVNAVGNGIKSLASRAVSWGRDLIDNFVSGIKGAIGKVKDAVSGIASTVKDFLGFSEPEKGPLSNFHTYAPDMMALFAQGIRENEKLLTDQIEKSFDFGKTTIRFSDSSIGKMQQDNRYNGGSTINQYISAVPMTPAELARQTVDAFDRLRWA